MVRNPSESSRTERWHFGGTTRCHANQASLWQKFYNNENVPNSSSAFGKTQNNTSNTNDMSKKVTMIERQREYENKIKNNGTAIGINVKKKNNWRTGGSQGETEINTRR